MRDGALRAFGARRGAYADGADALDARSAGAGAAGGSARGDGLPDVGRGEARGEARSDTACRAGLVSGVRGQSSYVDLEA